MCIILVGRDYIVVYSFTYASHWCACISHGIGSLHMQGGFETVTNQHSEDKMRYRPALTRCTGSVDHWTGGV